MQLIQTKSPYALLTGLLCLVVWIIGPMSGCAEDQAAEASPSGCGSTGCPDDQVCLDNGTCTLPGQSVSLALRIQPPSESGVVEQHVTGLTLGPDTPTLDIPLIPSTLVMGMVTVAGDVPETVGGARVLFRLKEGIPSVPVTRETHTDEDDGAYEIDLVPGIYQVTVFLENSAYPPFRVGERTVSGGIMHLNFQLTDPEDYYVVQGQLVRTRPGVTDSEVPIASATVSLESSPDATVVSTSDLTDVEGRFTVLVPPGDRHYVIRISPSEDNPLVPNLSLSEVQVVESVDLGVILAGEWADTVQVGGTVIGLNGETTPIAQATFYLQSELEWGTFSRTTLTNADGTFAEQVIPGEYRITVVPPAAVDWAASNFSQSWLRSALDEHYDLPQKPVLQGVVTRPDGQVVENVRITSKPIGYPVSSLSLGTVQAETDAGGLFQMRIHPGRQLIMAIPPADGCLSPVIDDGIEVSLSGVQLALRLQDFGCASVRVLAPDGMPLMGARVEVYLHDGESWFLFAERTTDGEGLFSMGLPTVGQIR